MRSAHPQPALRSVRVRPPEPIAAVAFETSCDRLQTVRIQTIVILALSAAGVTGCGSAGSLAASRPDPPTPITLSAYVGGGAIHVAPARLGAGPVLLTVADQSSRAVALVLSRAGSRQVIARTAPINPGGVTQVKLDLGSGTYAVSARPAIGRHPTLRARVDAAATVTTTVRVGPRRPGGGNQVLQP
jgi:hypothetical protein